MRRGAAVVALLLAGCSGGADPSSTTVTAPVDESYADAFTALVEALEASDFETAADLTATSHIPLLALAEGLTGPQVAGLTDADRRAVAANFWSGFVAQLQPTLGSPLSAMRIERWTESEVGDTNFAIAELFRSADASVRRMVMIEGDDGWTVDLLASFPSAMINLVPDAAQVIRATGDQQLIAALRDWQPSVELVIDLTADDPLLNQAGLQALESIIR